MAGMLGRMYRRATRSQPAAGAAGEGVGAGVAELEERMRSATVSTRQWKWSYEVWHRHWFADGTSRWRWCGAWHADVWMDPGLKFVAMDVSCLLYTSDAADE